MENVATLLLLPNPIIRINDIILRYSPKRYFDHTHISQEREEISKKFSNSKSQCFL